MTSIAGRARLLLLLSCCTALGCVHVRVVRTPRQQASPIETIVREWWVARATGDTVGLALLTTSDFRHVAEPRPYDGGIAPPAPVGRPATRWTIERWSVDDLHVEQADTQAVATYTWLTTRRLVDGRTRQRDAGEATDTLVLRNGRWAIRAHHEVVRR